MLTKLLQSALCKIQYLLAVLATIRHEPAILKDALIPDETGKKIVSLPDKYWRLEVLKCVWKDVPKVLTQRFCPLFWVSSIFPILWLFILARNVLWGVGAIIGWVWDKITESTVVNFLNNQLEKWVLSYENSKVANSSMSRKYTAKYKNLPKEEARSYFITDNNKVYFSSDCVTEASEMIRENRPISGHEYNRTIMIYFAMKHFGENWRHEFAKRIKQGKGDYLFEPEKPAQYTPYTLPIEEGFDWEKFTAKIKSKITASKLTVYSHNFFKFLFKWSIPVTGVLALLAGFVFLDSILFALEWVISGLSFMLAAFWEDRYGFLAALVILFMCCLAAAALFAIIVFLSDNGDDVRHYLGKTIKVVFAPIWWPIWMAYKGIRFIVTVSALFFKVAYNENCPSIKFEKKVDNK
jgi:hypothetical protein